MDVKLSSWRLILLWGLALKSAKTATAEVAVFNAVAAIPTQHVRTYASSTVGKVVEERTVSFSNVDQAVRNELQLFAGKLISKDVIDFFHKQNFLVDNMRKFDNLLDVHAIKKLTQISDNRFDQLIIWFGTKSPEEQEVVLDLLAAQLKRNSLISHNLLNFLEAGKATSNDEFRIIAAAVEKKWFSSISTKDMYDALGLSVIWDDEVFVRRVGHLIWNKFQIIGEKDFATFMVTKMRERSEDEIMWARIIYKLEKDNTVEMPLSGVFDELVRLKAIAAGNCRPIDAVKVLTSPEFLEVCNDVTRTSKEVGAVVVEKLLKLSTDELMWARLIYILQTDDSVPTIPSGVFDYLLQPYEIVIFGEDKCKPSQAVKYLTSPELSRNFGRLFSSKNFDAKLLAELLKKSHDELMWAKVLYMLKTDKSVSAPLNNVLTTLIHSWTEWPKNDATLAISSPFSMSKDVLTNTRFVDLCLYAHFSSDNPDTFLLEKLRERSTNEHVWAQALNALHEDQSVLAPLSGVLNALLHSWIGKPYNVADKQLISAYNFLLNCAVTIRDRLTPLTSPETKKLVNILLQWSNDEYMWAKFLYKLQQEQTFSAVASSAFDALLLSHDAAQTAQLNLPSLMIKYLKSSSFFQMHENVQSMDNVDAALWEHLLAQSSNQALWAKVLYLLQNNESKVNPLFTNLVTTLLAYWTHGSAGVTVSSNLYSKCSSFLESQGFVNLIAYARFSSDNPDAFVLEKLRERSADDFVWARLLNKLRKEHLKLEEQGLQLRKEDYALPGVFSALLHSWIGKPYNAAAPSKYERSLIVAYDYLTSQELADWYKGIMELEKKNADEAILDQLLKTSHDDVMWAKLLKKLMKDRAMDFSLSGVFESLLQKWKV